MSLKERIFGPRWESKDPSVRREAVATDRDALLIEQLPGIAGDDPDSGVRLAALKRLDDESAWLAARRRESDPGIVQAADQFLLRAVCNQPADPDIAEQRLDWLGSVEDTEALRRVARRGADSGLRRAALERIGAQGFLGDCIIAESDEALAQWLISRIDQTSTLKRIAEALRTRHKQRHRLVMQRMAALEGETGNHSARDELAGDLVRQAEQLARGERSGDRARMVEELQAHWNELPTVDPALARRFDGAMKIVRSALQPRRREADSGTAEQPESDAPAADSQLEACCKKARRLATSPVSDETGAALAELISEFDRCWKALTTPSAADRDARTHFRALTDELQSRLQSTQDNQPPAGDAEPASAGARDDPGTDADSARPSIEALQQELQTALERADEALVSGDIAASHQAIGEARSAYDRLPKRQRPAEAGGRLTRMAGKLKEMRDWQHWSNNKLRERLIERVTEIDVENLHPDAVTARLKELRQRWKELDDLEILPGDKRRFAAPQRQWRRFRKACKETFDAARPYLEKRSEMREQSLRELEQFLESSDALLADETTPGETLLRYQRAAREAIRNLDELPPASRGRMASSLRNLMDRISDRLEKHFQAVEAEKRRLVAEARKLEHERDRSAAIERAKALQAAWKKAGRSRRKVDEKLWREFREPIDPLFEDRKKDLDRQRRAQHEHAEALKALCQRMEEYARGDAAGLEDATGPVAGLEEEFNRHSAIPPALRKRFDKALNTFQKRLDQARREAEKRKSAHLERLAEALQQAWAERAAGRTPRLPAELPEVPDNDQAGQRLIERLRRHGAAEVTTETLAAEVDRSTAKARQVVIEMECLSGLETPEEDRQMRMDYQIRRLSDRLGEGSPRPDLASERSELLRRWLDSFPHDTSQHDALDKRFRAADKILQEMTSG